VSTRPLFQPSDGGSLNKRLARGIFCALALGLSIFSTRPGHASFEELPTGARAAGMGNAFAAVADDVYAAYYNPAGLVHVRRGELTAYYARLYAGLTDNSSIGRSYIAYAHPLRKRGTIAFSYLQLSLAGLYTENTMGLSYAHAVGTRWNLGTTMKFLRKSFGSDQYTQNAINADTGASLGAPDPLFANNGTSKSGVAVDLGAQYRLTRIYGLGFTIMNFNTPNMALSEDDTDKVNAIYKAGIARRTKTSTVDAEISMRRFTSEEFRFNIGGERWMKSGLGFRGGLGFGQRQYQITSLGMSYRFSNLEFGYGLIYPLTGVSGTFGTHQISMTFRLGKRD
jgi:hypothetical protein